MADYDNDPSKNWPYPVVQSEIENEAQELFMAIQNGQIEALGVVKRYDRSADPSSFSLDEARNVLARSYGFSGWLQVERYFDTVARYSCSPNVEPAPYDCEDETALANDFLRLACLTQGAQDHPSRWARARNMLDAHPELSHVNIYAASVAGDITAVKAILDADANLASTPGGPHNWEPLLYVAFSRLDHETAGQASVDIVRLLVSQGADPNAGYLWAGFPCAYTVLTGVFGEGENGPVRSPPHRYSYELAEILIEAGADPNDAQTLYNRMFSRDDEHLRFLFAHGLGKERGRSWHRLLGEQSHGWVGNPGDVLAYQLQWAATWNYQERVRLLVEKGAGVNQPFHRTGGRSPYEEAVYHGNEAIAEYLADHGAEAFPLDNLEAVRLMADLGFDVNACGMHDAARYGYLDMIKLLADLGADVSLQDSGHDISVIGYASHYQQDHVIDYLAQYAGIHRAVKSEKLPRVRALLSDDPGRANERDEEGNTPLHCLDVDNRMVDTSEILRLLVTSGAYVNARNKEGMTPLDRLERLSGFSRRDDLAEMLRGHGAVGSDTSAGTKSGPVT